MSAVWAEFSSALHSERMREVNAQAKKQGKALNGRKQYGWAQYPTATTPRPDYEERAVMTHILWLRDERELSWRKIADAVETRLAAKEGRRPVPAYEGNTARRFGHMRCARCYQAAKELNLQPASSF
jgi:DNA invertase Pin-like site-specific DNA recombinase